MNRIILAMFTVFLFAAYAGATTIIDYNFNNQSWGSLNPNVDSPTHWSIQSTGGMSNGPCIRWAVAGGTSGNQLQLNLAQGNEYWVEFDMKITGTMSGGMKFVKFFGTGSGSNDNMTLIVDYGGNEQDRVLYNGDTLCEANYSGGYAGGSSCANTQTWNITGSPINFGSNTWGHYKAHIKRASPGMRNGTLSVWWNGTLISQMSNMASNESSNSQFSYMTFGDYNQSTTTWYLWIDNLYVGTTDKGGGDTTSPSVTIATGNSAIDADSLSISGTASDAAGMSSCKYRIGSAPDASNGTPLSGTTSWSGTASGFSSGANTLYVGCGDAAGNWGANSINVTYTPSGGASSPATLLFSEEFEDASFSSRGWYDGTTGVTTSEHQTGTHAARFAFAQGGSSPSSPYSGNMRKLFTATDELYFSFYIKFATGWRGSQSGGSSAATYHPHLIYLLSDLDGDWDGMSQSYLDTYVEFLSDVGSPYTIRPHMAIQDSKNINYASGALPNNLSTENRSVARCNSPAQTGSIGDCYNTGGGVYYSADYFKDTAHSVTTNAWHKVEVYLKMNTISGGVSQANGIMQEWVDGVATINSTTMRFRTNQHPTMKWQQFIIGPYIGDGSPIAQTFYLDNLNVYNGNPRGSILTPISTLSITSFDK